MEVISAAASTMLCRGLYLPRTRRMRRYYGPVAWPLREFNFKEHCFKKVTISFKGRSEVATILDSCGACPHNGLDLSKGLFKKIAPNGDGVVLGSWIWGDNGGSSEGEKPPPPKKTTIHKPPPPKTTKVAPKPKPTTSRSTAPQSSMVPTSSEAFSTSTTSTSSGANTPATLSSTSTAARVASTTGVLATENNIAAFNDILVRMGELLVASKSS